MESASSPSYYVAVPLEIFTQSNFAADFFQQKLNFTGKTAKSRFVPPVGGDLGVTYTVHLWLVGKRMVYFLLMLIERFSLAATVEAQSVDNGRNRCVRNRASL